MDMTVKKSRDLLSWLWPIVISASLITVLFFIGPVPLQADQAGFRPVDLDRFIDTERATADGKRVITMAAPISFEARLKRQPEPRTLRYVYTALELGGVNPLPVVEHRMFVESAAGRIIPVYVEKGAVDWIKADLRVDQRTRFIGYHLYNYAQGPAILVTGYQALPAPEDEALPGSAE
jgi:glycosyltransferase involved in cell wall biosynthesis